MEAVLGRTLFSVAAAGLAALGGVSVSEPAEAFCAANLGWAGFEDRAGAGLEADGIDNDPLLRELGVLIFEPEPVLAGAGFWVCFGAFCGFLEGIP
jgi:hypothetical protein